MHSFCLLTSMELYLHSTDMNSWKKEKKKLLKDINIQLEW